MKHDDAMHVLKLLLALADDATTWSFDGRFLSICIPVSLLLQDKVKQLRKKGFQVSVRQARKSFMPTNHNYNRYHVSVGIAI